MAHWDPHHDEDLLSVYLLSQTCSAPPRQQQQTRSAHNVWSLAFSSSEAKMTGTDPEYVKDQHLGADGLQCTWLSSTHVTPYQLLTPPDSLSGATADTAFLELSPTFTITSLDDSMIFDSLDPTFLPSSTPAPFSFATFPVTRPTTPPADVEGYSPADPSFGGVIPHLMEISRASIWEPGMQECDRARLEHDFTGGADDTTAAGRFPSHNHPSFAPLTSTSESFDLSPSVPSFSSPHISALRTSISPPPSPPTSIHGNLDHVAQLLVKSRTEQLAAQEAARTQTKIRRRAPPEDDKVRPKGARTFVEHDVSCTRCQVNVGKVILRGKSEDFEEEYKVNYLCLMCGVDGFQEDAEIAPEQSYAASLSAFVDGLQGKVTRATSCRPPVTRATALLGHKRLAEEIFLSCDVCTRETAVGGVERGYRREALEFAVEAICAECSEKYARCTDCGGGGGTRLGIGRWRCKELFCVGRKTCQLSHLRLGSLADMTYDILFIDEVPSPDLIADCAALYRHNLLAVLATPEILEPIAALAQTYQQAENLLMDSWGLVEPLFRTQYPAGSNSKRYLALRWSTQTPRKKTKSTSASSKKAKVPVEPTLPANAGSCKRPGQQLAGFVLAEVDWETGTLFVAATTPWATGETFDATTILMQTLTRRIEADLVKLNVGRKRGKLATFPSLDKVWTLTFFQRESRLVHHLEHRRGFFPLEEYLRKYPATPQTDFAPYRPSFLPPECLNQWTLLVRKLTPNDEWNARSPAKAIKKVPKSKK